jgi:histidyl-tRNA synthetase
VAILGENEIASGQVAIKHLASGRQEVYAQERAAAAVKDVVAGMGEVIG